MANWSFLKPAINTAPGALNPTSPYTTQFPGSSPYTRLSLWAALDKALHQRGSYVTQLADTQSPFISGELRVNFDDVFLDTNYSVLVSVDDPTWNYGSPPFAAVPINVLRSPASVSCRLWFPFAATSPAIGAVPLNRPINVSVLAWHD